MTYRDRRAAGAVLAGYLAKYAGTGGVIVLGLVRGGIPVAAEVARRLRAPLDALVVRKLGLPWAPEVAFGAVAAHGVQVLIGDLAARLSPGAMAAVLRHETVELARRERRYRPGRPPLDLHASVAVLVDDGLATGATARAAVAVARRLDAARVVLAVPVGSPEAVATLQRAADEVVCPWQPAEFGAVSQFYDDFGQVNDAEVTALLTATPRL